MEDARGRHTSERAKGRIQTGHQGPSSDYPRLLGTVNRAPSSVRCRKIQEETRAVTPEEMWRSLKKTMSRPSGLRLTPVFDTVGFCI